MRRKQQPSHAGAGEYDQEQHCPAGYLAGLLEKRESIAYTGDNSMTRLRTETSSTLAASDRGVDSVVSTPSEHGGSPSGEVAITTTS